MIFPPIFFNSEIVGVIGLICFKTEQRESFLMKKESYISFLEEISRSL